MSNKRKAWDAAILTVAQEKKVSVKASRGDMRRDTRRRANARRWIATSDLDDLRLKVEARLEALEESTVEGVEDEEWDNEEEDESRGRKAKKQAAKKLKAGSCQVGGASGGGVVPAKKYRVKSLAQHLLDDHAARGGGISQRPCYATAEGAPPRVRTRSLCVVTGLIGRYRDVGSGLPFSSKKSQTQLKETPPPWLQLSGNAPYFEALRFIKAANAETSEGDSCL
mmetsp:Transcript_28409/g.58129  ORF Transcript_28409/g.58129 Transcript_28409/m.58129 type:complete len:225 (+) Transcript_28409:127-801(+)